MPGMPAMQTSERDLLLAYLDQQRDGLRNAAYGLTEEQVRAKPTSSALSIGGLLKHTAHTERQWVQTMQGQAPSGGEDAYVDTFILHEGETREQLLAQLDQVATETAEAVAALPDLDVRVSLPPAPWLPRDPEGFSARWILLHMVEELARHAGHADIIREHLDGATMYELMAAAEGWPETEWLKPWRPRES